MSTKKIYNTSFCLIVCISAFCSSIAVAGKNLSSTELQQFRQTFANSVFEVCLESQGVMSIRQASTQQQHICNCYQEKTTEIIFSNSEYQSALRTQNVNLLTNLPGQIVSTQVRDSVFNSCKTDFQKKSTKESSNNYGIDVNKPSNSTGLQGNVRKNFINAVIASCINTPAGKTSKAEAYCSCISNSVASSLSEVDVLEVGKQTPKGKKIFGETDQLAKNRCSVYLN